MRSDLRPGGPATWLAQYATSQECEKARQLVCHPCLRGTSGTNGDCPDGGDARWFLDDCSNNQVNSVLAYLGQYGSTVEEAETLDDLSDSVLEGVPVPGGLEEIIPPWTE